MKANCGELPWTEVDAWRKELRRDFERALAETKPPERPDYETRIASSSKRGGIWRTANERQ